MKRADAIKAIRAAAGLGDMKTCTRIFCESRISLAVYDEAVQAGRNFAQFIARRDAEKQSANSSS